MISVHVDGEIKEVLEGATLRDVVEEISPGQVVAIILPGKKDAAISRNFLVQTSAGELVIEADAHHSDLLSSPDLELEYSIVLRGLIINSTSPSRLIYFFDTLYQVKRRHGLKPATASLSATASSNQ